MNHGIDLQERPPETLLPVSLVKGSIPDLQLQGAPAVPEAPLVMVKPVEVIPSVSANAPLNPLGRHSANAIDQPHLDDQLLDRVVRRSISGHGPLTSSTYQARHAAARHAAASLEQPGPDDKVSVQDVLKKDMPGISFIHGSSDYEGRHQQPEAKERLVRTKAMFKRLGSFVISGKLPTETELPAEPVEKLSKRAARRADNRNWREWNPVITKDGKLASDEDDQQLAA